MRLSKIESGDCYCNGIGDVSLTFDTDVGEWNEFIIGNPNMELNSFKIDLCDGMKLSFKKGEIKVIFNPPATILFKNGKKYVSKAHNEEFDEEKGLLMCLAKANGISHLELKRMIKNAKRQSLQAKEKKSKKK